MADIGRELIEALEQQYRGNIASARANIRVYLENPAGIGEHPDVVQAIDSQIAIIAENQEKLDILGIGAGDPKSTAIGIGMWLGIIMAYNVWFVIWPNQKKALGMVESSPEEKAKSAKTAMLFSRTNTLLSFPMLLSMVAAQNLY